MMIKIGLKKRSLAVTLQTLLPLISEIKIVSPSFVFLIIPSI